jgi:hypothetical protein
MACGRKRILKEATVSTRYEDAPESVTAMLHKVRTECFPELVNAKILVLFDLKKRGSKGMVVLARIMKANDLIRHLTTDNKGLIEGYDYIITIDKVFWDNTADHDRERVIRHELRHTYFDIDAEDNPYKLIDHDITDFYAEVELNRNDPKWRERCASLTSDIYDQMKESGRKVQRSKKTPIEIAAAR